LLKPMLEGGRGGKWVGEKKRNLAREKKGGGGKGEGEFLPFNFSKKKGKRAFGEKGGGALGERGGEAPGGKKEGGRGGEKGGGEIFFDPKREGG